MDSRLTSSPAYAASMNESSNSSSLNQSGHSFSSFNHSYESKRVNFGGTGQNDERKREKFLTAKYGAHQMALIRKRLRVEMWMYEKLQEFYGSDNIEIDLDEVLDLSDDADRRKYLKEILIADTSEKVDVFIEELLEKAKTL